jgi:hypothetical protein
MSWRPRSWLWWIPGAACVGIVGWAAFTPVHVDSREKVFAIPEGTWARRRAGDDVDILPSQIRLTLGLDDVLLLKNRDVVPQTFGPALLMPGQNFACRSKSRPNTSSRARRTAVGR